MNYQRPQAAILAARLREPRRVAQVVAGLSWPGSSCPIAISSNICYTLYMDCNLCN